MQSFCLLWSTGTEEGFARRARCSFQQNFKNDHKNNHKCLPKWLLSQFFECQKKKGPGGGRRKIDIQAPLVMQPQSLTGPLSGAAPEKYADSSAHIAHHHLCGTSESRACIVSV